MRHRFRVQRTSGQYRFLITALKAVTIEDGKEKPLDDFFATHGAVWRDGRSFELILTEKNVNRPNHRAVARLKPMMEPGWHYGTFEPMYFFSDQGRVPDKLWRQIHEHTADELTHATIRREGDDIFLVITADNVVVEWTISLAGRKYHSQEDDGYAGQHANCRR